MLKIAEEQTFKWEVPVFVPVDGGHRKESVTVTYIVVPTEELLGHDLLTEDGVRGFLDKVVKRIDGLVDEAGAPHEWNDELKARVLKLPYVRVALSKAYRDAVTKAREGN